MFWLKVWVLETIHSCEDAGSAPNQLGGLRQSVPPWASVSSSVDGGDDNNNDIMIIVAPKFVEKSK